MEECVCDVPGCNLKDTLLEKEYHDGSSMESSINFFGRDFVGIPGNHQCIFESARKFIVQNNELKTSDFKKEWKLYLILYSWILVI